MAADTPSAPSTIATSVGAPDAAPPAPAPKRPRTMDESMQRVRDAATKVQGLREVARKAHVDCAEKSSALFDAEREHRDATKEFQALARA